jgi:hypothetical protein
MAKRMFSATGTTAGAAVCTLILACSSTTPTTPVTTASADSGSTTPAGATPVTTTPFPACSPLEPGCFTYAGTYATPATTSCTPAGAQTAGAADTHCAGQPPQAVSPASCSVVDAGAAASEDAGSTGGSDDAGAAPAPGPCGENGPDYGSTMYGTEADDDDCKYHVSYTASPICENSGTYFVVTASYLTENSAPLTAACAFAEVCLSNTHPGPALDGRPPAGKQVVVEGPPGTYTIGPVEFDAPGDWTVRFHFNESCCDIADSSPHGHAAFHVTVP